jgi:hypothetical protein
MRNVSLFVLLTLAASLLGFGQGPPPQYGVVVTDEYEINTNPTTSSRHRRSASPEPCHIAPRELGRDAIDILRVEALSTQPTDGTYADEGYGQGEFETVRLLEVLKSPIHWTSGHIFRVHPFPGKRSEQDNFAPEHLKVGKNYYLVYTYYLDKEPSGESDLIGLTRCGVLAGTSAVRAQLLDGAATSTQRHAEAEK